MTANWTTQPLVTICAIKPSKAEARRRLAPDDSVSFVPMNMLGEYEKHFQLNGNKPLNEVAGSYTYFADGDVLLAKITPCFENGKMGIARDLTNGIGFGSSEFLVLRPSDKIIADYLYYFFYRNEFRVDGAKVMTGAVGHKRIPLDYIEQLAIPLPSPAEQQRIVAILDKAFSGIATATANAEKNLANARELFDSVLASIFEIPRDDWTMRSLSDHLNITHGFAFDGKNFAKSSEAHLPIVLTPGNYTENARLDFSDGRTKRLSTTPPKGFVFDKGDLTVVMTDLSSKMKILGKPAFVDRENVLHNQRIGRVIFKSNELIPRFVYYFLQSGGALKRVRDTATGTMVRHTAPSRILSNVIRYPPPAQQHEFVKILDQMADNRDSFVTNFQRKIAALVELKQSLLRQAFAGELR